MYNHPQVATPGAEVEAATPATGQPVEAPKGEVKTPDTVEESKTDTAKDGEVSLMAESGIKDDELGVDMAAGETKSFSSDVAENYCPRPTLMAPPTLQKYRPIEFWGKRERYKTKNGYIRVRVREHPNASRAGWVYEHRLVVEKHLGRLLYWKEEVHHISQNKSDNHHRNLVACTHEQHVRAHALLLKVA